MEYRDSNPRKKAKADKKNARRKKGSAGKVFAVFLVFLLVCAVGIALSLTVFFKIENITVSGNALYSSENISKTSGVKKGDNIFLTTDKNVTNNLMNSHPFVEDVKLKRILPDTLEIEITEATEKYCYLVGGEYFSASEKHKALKSYSVCPAQLILVKTQSVKEVRVGENIVFTDETEKQYFDKLLHTINESGINVTQIDISNTLSVTARVEERFDVNFGSIINIEEKIAHLAKMVDEIDKNKTGKINLSAWSAEKNEAYFVQGNLQ